MAHQYEPQVLRNEGEHPYSEPGGSRRTTEASKDSAPMIQMEWHRFPLSWAVRQAPRSRTILMEFMGHSRAFVPHVAGADAFTIWHCTCFPQAQVLGQTAGRASRTGDLPARPQAPGGFPPGPSSATARPWAGLHAGAPWPPPCFVQRGSNMKRTVAILLAAAIGGALLLANPPYDHRHHHHHRHHHDGPRAVVRLP